MVEYVTCAPYLPGPMVTSLGDRHSKFFLCCKTEVEIFFNRIRKTSLLFIRNERHEQSLYVQVIISTILYELEISSISSLCDSFVTFKKNQIKTIKNQSMSTLFCTLFSNIAHNINTSCRFGVFSRPKNNEA